MNRDYTGGLFWDILLITKYNEDWIDFYHSLIKVLPCEKCREETKKYHEWKPLPKFYDTNEKNQYLWDLRLNRGGEVWKRDVIEKGYTLESWINLFENKPFSRIKK
jgi:hypothetical protein